MFGVFALLAGLSFCVGQNFNTESHLTKAPNSSFGQMFASCPDVYKHFCISGTCRYIVSEEIPACICFKGYIGSRCESMDLLHIMSENPQSILAIAFAAAVLVALSLIIGLGLGVFFCRQKRTISQLTLLNNSDV
ncbi:probetacellulin-like isoform X2 [Pleurodeles waltl]|uniref:probetacellulin-like isoform X2 n=1 Tax=Pleurodeles waltl TaxID=8319 RepID=UPI00370951BD